MRLALLSDIHANLRALDACLAHARAAGASRFAILGDLVGYGPDPAAVVERVQQLAAAGAIVIKGNHDELAAEGGSGDTLMHLGADWTRDQLSGQQRNYLRELPMTAQLGSAYLVHASADEPERWHYVDNVQRAALSLDAAIRINPSVHHVFSGHVHRQTLYYRGTGRSLLPFTPAPGVSIPVPAHRYWLATIGSVGQPRDGDPRAMYALLDLPDPDSTAQGVENVIPSLRFERVAYDHRATAAAIRACCLPELFAMRLEQAR